jgi:hypothetical protein
VVKKRSSRPTVAVDQAGVIVDGEMEELPAIAFDCLPSWLRSSPVARSPRPGLGETSQESAGHAPAIHC